MINKKDIKTEIIETSSSSEFIYLFNFYTISITHASSRVTFIHSTAFILSRTSSKPNDVKAEKGNIESNRVLVSLSAISIKSVCSWGTGLSERIFCKMESSVPTNWKHDTIKKQGYNAPQANYCKGLQLGFIKRTYHNYHRFYYT